MTSFRNIIFEHGCLRNWEGDIRFFRVLDKLGVSNLSIVSNLSNYGTRSYDNNKRIPFTTLHVGTVWG
jgi:hypothetical protein